MGFMCYKNTFSTSYQSFICIKNTPYAQVTSQTLISLLFLSTSISVKFAWNVQGRQDTARVPADRTGWRDPQGQQENTFRITLARAAQSRHRACHCLTADNIHSVQHGVYRGHRLLCTALYAKYQTTEYDSCKSTFDYSPLVIWSTLVQLYVCRISPSMWKCSLTKTQDIVAHFKAMCKHWEKSFHFLLIKL